MAGGVARYVIDALVADGDMVAAAWTGTVPSGAEFKGLGPVPGLWRAPPLDPARLDRGPARLSVGRASS
jgi:hypothetical protein